LLDLRLPRGIPGVVRVVSFAFVWCAISVGSAVAGERLERLAPPDTDSPRAVIRSFLDSAGNAVELADEAAPLLYARPGFRWVPAVRELNEAASENMERAAATLDLSDIAPSLLAQTKLEAVLQIYEILKRVDPAVLAAAPDAAQMDANVGSAKHSYTIPGTPLQIRRISEPSTGDSPTDETVLEDGAFRFSADSIAKLRQAYPRAIEDPTVWGESKNAYQSFATSPGGIIPPAWYTWIEKGPGWLRLHFEGQALWQWVAFLGVVAFSVLLCTCAWVFLRPLVGRRGFLALVGALALPTAIRMSTRLTEHVAETINLVGDVFQHLNFLLLVIGHIAWVWQVIVVFSWAARTLPFWRFKRNTVQASLTRTVIRTIGILVTVVVIGSGLTELGVPLIGVLAGLGIGGLAVALAAQPTMENLIAGVMLYLDEPVRVGDECEFEDVRGTIEEIGIRSTRIRSLDGTLITMTNADFSKLRLKNHSAGQAAFSTSMNLALDSPGSRVKQFLSDAEARMREHSNIKPETVNVQLLEIASASLLVIARCEFEKRSATIEDEKERLRLDLIDAVQGAGLSLVAREAPHEPVAET